MIWFTEAVLVLFQQTVYSLFEKQFGSDVVDGVRALATLCVNWLVVAVAAAVVVVVVLVCSIYQLVHLM